MKNKDRLGITYDYIADDLQQKEGESLSFYTKRLHSDLIVAEVALMEAMEQHIKAQSIIAELLKTVREFGILLSTPPKPGPTMTAFDLGWTPTGT